MEFCPKCGKLLAPKEENGKVVLVCTACGFKKSADVEKHIKTEKGERTHEGVSVKGETINLPITSAICPKCRNKKAYFWIEQTRSADEPPTRFYKCTKCGYTWREYS